MIGSPAIASLVALWGFWVLLCVGWIRGELRLKSTVIFLILWLFGFVGLQSMCVGLLFISYVAVLDIALVFVIFHGDVRIT